MTDTPRTTPQCSEKHSCIAGVLVALLSCSLAACSSTNAPSQAQGGTTSIGGQNTVVMPQGGTGGTPSGAGGSTTGASAGSGGSTSLTAGAGGMMTMGGGGAPASGGASGGQPSGGSGGASSGGMTSSGGTGGALDFGDVGIEGDGDRMISSPFMPDAANSFSNAPVGHMFTFQMMSADSTIFPGIKGPFTRDVWVYVPSQYVPGTPAPLMVMQDGGWAVWLGDNEPHMSAPGTPNLPGTANLPRVLDNLIAAGELPPIVAIFPNNGGGDAEGSERGLEYDTVSGKYAEWAEMELLPRVSMEAQTQLNLDLQFTTDPRGRATMGGSSGGAASFSAAWWHPDYFARVISFSGTFVRQASPEDPMFPHGCWSYHDFDPYDEAMPNGVIMMSDVKPLRIWLEVGSNDMGSGSGPGSYRDFRLANQRMAVSLQAKGYHYHFDLANGAGHVDGNVVAQTLPEAMKWLWRGYPIQ